MREICASKQWLVAGAVIALSGTVASQSADLQKKYPATLDYQERVEGREWTSEATDVWALRSFRFDAGAELDVDLGPSDVVFGVYGTNVVWAAVLPRRPARLKSTLAGSGERIASVFLRFNPARVGELFPRRTVIGQGPDELVTMGKRVCAGKINGSWQAGNLPVIPWRRSIVVDMDTDKGVRRFFMVDTDAGSVEYEPAFEGRGLPSDEEISRSDALKAFDDVWEAFDREYAMFTIKPDVNWGRLKTTYRRQAARASTGYDAGVAIAAMLGHLEDLHVWVRVKGEFVPGFSRPRPLNGSRRAVERIVGGVNPTQHDLVWGRTEDGIGYVDVYELNDQQAPAAMDDALEELADTWALVFDLRFNGGGDELIARKHAGRFLDEERVYSYNQYRSGSRHDQLGDRLARAVSPRGPWRYESPVVVLLGRRTMSSAESFALMMAQSPQVTTMGDNTAGSSANPRRIEGLPGGIEVNMPRWIDLMPDGVPLDVVGIAPDIRVEATGSDISDTADPVLQAALDHLREQPRTERLPGKRR